MTRRTAAIAALACLFALVPGDAPAWEAQTTHAGLAEQAALSSSLHERLAEQFGFDRGVYEQLTVPPADAEALFALFERLNPTHGYVPDGRGRLRALGWLAAGAVMADSPPEHAGHHFFDPSTGRGLDDATIDRPSRKIEARLLRMLAREEIAKSGVPAPDWVVDTENPMSLAGFLAQYAKSVAARTPAERQRHAAGMLLAAGAILHVLQDMGSPSHVRNDLGAHLDQIGNHRLDVGSRFERLAALGYGRLGIPGPDGDPHRAASLRAYFTAEDGSGLADVVAARFFSRYTLPRARQINPKGRGSEIRSRLAESLVKPSPTPPARLDFIRARREGARLRDASGTCLAVYHLERRKLTWSLPDDCAVEQIAAVLPITVRYGAGLLDWLFRGQIAFDRDGTGASMRVRGADYGAGVVRLFWDDGRGVRAPIGEPIQISGGDEEATVATVAGADIPEEARRIVALFEGQDQAGQPLVATGVSDYPVPANEASE